MGCVAVHMVACLACLHDCQPHTEWSAIGRHQIKIIHKRLPTKRMSAYHCILHLHLYDGITSFDQLLNDFFHIKISYKNCLQDKYKSNIIMVTVCKVECNRCWYWKAIQPPPLCVSINMRCWHLLFSIVQCEYCDGFNVIRNSCAKQVSLWELHAFNIMNWSMVFHKTHIISHTHTHFDHNFLSLPLLQSPTASPMNSMDSSKSNVNFVSRYFHQTV